MSNWMNKPKPTNLRNLIRHSVKATKRKPQIWHEIVQMAVFLAKNQWNISDKETITKIAEKIYLAAKKALEPMNKIPEDFLVPMKIEAPEFKPTKIDGILVQEPVIETDAVKNS